MSSFNNNNVHSGLPATFDVGNWYHASNGSIYIKCLPNNYGKEEITDLVSFIGKINRIDIVNSPPKANGATYRMAFVHFDYWYSMIESIEVRGMIARSFDEKTDFRLGSDGVVVTINTRPVPKTDYNVDQLSDMFHRLREELTATIQKQAIENGELRKEIESLRALQVSDTQFLQEKMAITEKVIQENMAITEKVIQEKMAITEKVIQEKMAITEKVIQEKMAITEKSVTDIMKPLDDVIKEVYLLGSETVDQDNAVKALHLRMDSLEKETELKFGELDRDIQDTYNMMMSDMKELEDDMYVSIKTVSHVAEDLSTYVYGRKCIELIP